MCVEIFLKYVCACMCVCVFVLLRRYVCANRYWYSMVPSNVNTGVVAMGMSLEIQLESGILERFSCVVFLKGFSYVVY